MHLSAEQIEDFFNRYGWTYSRESDDTWVTGVRTEVSAFRIMVRLTEHWVFFIINPLVVAPLRNTDRLRVYYAALRYNLDMNFAKLGVDSDGDVFIAIELPTENFAYSHFVDALDGLSHHASVIYTELFGLAHSPERTVGRYDEELGDVSPALNFPDDLLQLIDDDEDDDDLDLPNTRRLRQFWESDVEDEEVEEDVFIDGRRLKLFDESGNLNIKLETGADEDASSDSWLGREAEENPDSTSDSDTTDPSGLD
jgi:hypothetical protein